MIEGILQTLLVFVLAASYVAVRILAPRIHLGSAEEDASREVILNGKPENRIHDLRKIVYHNLNNAVGEDLAALKGTKKLRSVTVPLEIDNGVEELGYDFETTIPKSVYSSAETIDELVDCLVEHLDQLIRSG